MKKRPVTFQVVSEDLYNQYKKILIDQKTTPTADFNAHIRKVVEGNTKG